MRGQLRYISLSIYSAQFFRFEFLGNVMLSDIWATYPFVDSTCSFYVYGIDLYDIVVYSLSMGVCCQSMDSVSPSFPHNLIYLEDVCEPVQ